MFQNTGLFIALENEIKELFSSLQYIIDMYYIGKPLIFLHYLIVKSQLLESSNSNKSKICFQTQEEN